MAEDEFSAGGGQGDGMFATDAELAAHTGDATDAHDASAVSFAPTGTIAGTDVQTALAEVATDAASALSTHEADATSVHGVVDTAQLALRNAVNTFTSTQTFSAGINVSGGNFTLGTLASLGGLYGASAAIPAAIADASTAHVLNIVYSDNEVEAALDALGTKVNAILAALRSIRGIAT